jgi:hypothetical protein
MRKNAVYKMEQSDLITKRLQKSCPIDDSEDSSDGDVGPEESSIRYKAKGVGYVDKGYLEDSEEDEACMESTDSSSNTNANSDKESENRIIAELGLKLSEKAPTLNSNFQSYLAINNPTTEFQPSSPSPSAPPLSLAGSRMSEGDRYEHNGIQDLTIDENEGDLNIKEIFFIALQSVLYEHVLQPSSYSSPTAKIAREQAIAEDRLFTQQLLSEICVSIAYHLGLDGPAAALVSSNINVEVLVFQNLAITDENCELLLEMMEVTLIRMDNETAVGSGAHGQSSLDMGGQDDENNMIDHDDHDDKDDSKYKDVNESEDISGGYNGENRDNVENDEAEEGSISPTQYPYPSPDRGGDVGADEVPAWLEPQSPMDKVCAYGCLCLYG